jgi:hypothetical protein
MGSEQLALFAEPAPRRTARSPICSYMQHCGARVTFGESEDMGGCINTPMVCERCGARGIESMRTDL